ncbi:MAG: vitamin K epoxide reductase family protein [Kofleriaceae bacterium]
MRPFLWLVVVGAALGLLFAGVSTSDFVQHLDRQVHSLHCSFIPGGGAHNDPSSGCAVAMMSPYSSILRSHLWGGIPISLGAMSVFAFLLFYAIDLALTRRKDDPKATLFLVAAACLPALVSAIMLIISLTQLGTTCKLCVGIYSSSALTLVGAILTWRNSRQNQTMGTSRSGGHRLEVGVSTSATSTGFLAAMFGIGVAFVVIPVLLYLGMAPDNSKFIGTCEGLAKPEDTYGVMMDVSRHKGGAPAIEVLDPLCPACKAFEDRLKKSGLEDKLDRRAILFPLDNTCNWMITETTHPGACTVSEAVLCAGVKAPDVIEWAFANQDQIRADTAKDPQAAARAVKAKFPELASCVGSPEAKSRLNKSLRWSVTNNVHVLTPQLFVDNTKLCDEDVDLGLEFALSVMLDRHARGTLAVPVTAGSAAQPIQHVDAPTTPEKKKAAPVEKPADKPAEKPETPADKPVEKPAEPAEKPAEKPADDKPVTSPSADGSAQ